MNNQYNSKSQCNISLSSLLSDSYHSLNSFIDFAKYSGFMFFFKGYFSFLNNLGYFTINGPSIKSKLFSKYINFSILQNNQFNKPE